MGGQDSLAHEDEVSGNDSKDLIEEAHDEYENVSELMDRSDNLFFGILLELNTEFH